MFGLIITIIILVILAAAIGPNRPILPSAIYTLAMSGIYLADFGVNPGLVIDAVFWFATALLYFLLLRKADRGGMLEGSALFFRSLALATLVSLLQLFLYILTVGLPPVLLLAIAVGASVCLLRFGPRGIDKALDKIFVAPHIELPIQEQFIADLKRALRLKSEKNLPQALQIVNNLLIKDPNWAEALLLKAQILDEAYGNKEAAKSILKKIMQMKPEGIQATHSAATYLYEELCAGEPRKL